MKLKYEMTEMELDNQTIIVPVGEKATEFGGVLRVNKSALDIIKLLNDDITEENIVNRLSEKYSDDNGNIKEYVHEYVEELKEAGLLE